MNKHRVPLRILHVVESIGRGGGVQEWLGNIYPLIDAARFQMDTWTSSYGRESHSCIPANHIIYGQPHRKPIAYGRTFLRVLRQHGPYEIVHSHIQHHNGFVLSLAKLAGVPIRVAHSHVDTIGFRPKAGIMRRGYERVMLNWIQRYATSGLAVSQSAGAALFGSGWDKDPRWEILTCGIDLSAFHVHVDPAAVRSELNLPSGRSRDWSCCSLCSYEEPYFSN